jgi:type IV pilus assembly protein PilA
VRARIAEPLARGAEAKTAIAEFFSANNRLPSTTASAGFNSAAAGFTRSVTWDNTNNEIRVAVGASVSPNNQAYAFSLDIANTSNGQITWDCRPDVTSNPTGTEDLPSRYTPGSCR